MEHINANTKDLNVQRTNVKFQTALDKIRRSNKRMKIVSEILDCVIKGMVVLTVLAAFMKTFEYLSNL